MALDTVLNRPVALATLRDDAPDFVFDTFIREARLVSQMDHPNIIKVHDIGIDPGGRPYFAMELKSGDSLERVVSGLKVGDISDQKRYPLSTLLEIFIKICEAVAYAHSKGVLHLDLKPANIQVGHFGEVVVCDWGLGKIIDAEDDLEIDRMLFNPDILNEMTLSGEIKGTPGFMAPEQTVASGVKTRQTDIYALGAILYCLLTFQSPVEGEKAEMLEKTRAGAIPMPKERFPERAISEGLNAVVRKAMALVPADRYASAQDIRNDVHNVLSCRPTMAENAGWWRELHLLYQRHKANCVVVFIAICLFGVLGTIFVNKLHERVAEAESARSFARIKKQEAESALTRYMTERDINSLTSENFNWMNSIYDLTDYRIYQDPMASLDLALKALDRLEAVRPDLKFISTQRGFIYCLLQQFDRAEEELSKYEDEFFFKLSRKYRVLKGGKPVLDVKDLTMLLDEVGRVDPSYRAAVIRFVICDAQLRDNAEERFEVAKHIFQKINPGWSGSVAYDPARKHLSLAGGGGASLTLAFPPDYLTGVGRVWKTPLNLFASVRPRSLSLRGTGFRNLSEIESLPIEELDLRQTQVSDLSQLKIMPALKDVVIAPEQFTEEQCSAAPAGIALKIRPIGRP